MQRRMLAIAALATAAAAAPIAAAQGATTSRTKIAQGFVYGGVTASGYPVVVELSKNARKVVRATIGLELMCQTPGDVTLPDTFTNLPIKSNGRFSHTYGPEEVVGDPATSSGP